LRVVAGRLRGRRLAAPPGESLRPTSDRARESLFNMLGAGALGGPDLAGAHFLDGFCGTGAAGIEALSRGARHATFIDRDLGPARANIRALDLESEASLIAADLAHLGPLPIGKQPATIAFLDPPYFSSLGRAALGALHQGGWLAADALLILESAARGPAEDLAGSGFALIDERRYGAARLSFLTRSLK
jgi:16S rRNA (guanine966-N2)-methyltransferase